MKVNFVFDKSRNNCTRHRTKKYTERIHRLALRTASDCYLQRESSQERMRAWRRSRGITNQCGQIGWVLRNYFIHCCWRWGVVGWALRHRMAYCSQIDIWIPLFFVLSQLSHWDGWWKAIKLSSCRLCILLESRVFRVKRAGKGNRNRFVVTVTAISLRRRCHRNISDTPQYVMSCSLLTACGWPRTIDGHYFTTNLRIILENEPVVIILVL